MNLPRVGITIGDMNGIGPEIIIKTLSDHRVLQFCIPVVYGQEEVLAFYRKTLHNSKFSFETITDTSKIKKGSVCLRNCGRNKVDIKPGTSTEEAGELAKASIDQCLQDLEDGKIDFMLTAPINKNNMPESFGGTGHTEYIASKYRDHSALMLLCSDLLRVALVTNHHSLATVTGIIDRQLVHRRIAQLHSSLKEDFYLAKPRIAVLGLNPHAGDGGLLGREEIEIIKPAMEQAEEEGIILKGPFSPDAFFANRLFTKFDGVLAMYHDQGLIPFKMLSYTDGVNFTAGLPIVRTSPDHGTAYDIAGTGKADESSLRSALFMALDIYRNLQQKGLDSSNPLNSKELRKEVGL